jgi:hypothetical protein
MPARQVGPECSCCVGLRSLDGANRPPGPSDVSMESTGGHAMRWNVQRAAKLASGCADYQMFWD